jgi:hypothetical protein
MRQSDKRQAQLQARCDDWNDRYPVGTAVNLLHDDGDVEETMTHSQASVLGGSTAVVWLEGKAGCCGLERVTPREADHA